MGDESPAFLVWGDGAAYHRVAGAALEEGVRTGDWVSLNRVWRPSVKNT